MASLLRPAGILVAPYQDFDLFVQLIDRQVFRLSFSGRDGTGARTASQLLPSSSFVATVRRPDSLISKIMYALD